MGASSRSLLTASMLLLALAPATADAKGDLTVSLSRLTVPVSVRPGSAVSFGVRYIVRGPTARRARATVKLVLKGGSSYTVTSAPAVVRPAIWKWEVRDTLPALAPGQYRATATITLIRGGKTISSTTSTKTLKVAGN